MPVNPRAKFEITATDRSAAVLRSSQQRFERFARQTSTIIASAFAGIGLGLLTREIIRKTREAEAAMAQLRTAVESTGGVAGFTADQLAGMAGDLQKLTTFGDEAVMSMQSVLLTFTRIRGPEFERTQQAILNVATRMGTTLQGAAVQLGKALNDPVANLGELGRAGIQFSKDQKAVIKAMVETGRLSEAQGIILDELETQFGGAAVAARDTFGGAIEGLKNAFGDLLEGGGGNLNDATDEINDLADLLQDPNTISAFANITAAIVTMTGAAAKAVTAFANLGKEIGEGFARAFGAGTPIDEAAERIEFLQRQIDSLRSGGPVTPGTSTDFLIKQNEAEIAQLEQMVQLNEELSRGRKTAAAEVTAEVDRTVDSLKEELDALQDNEASLKRQAEYQKAIAEAVDREAIRRQETAGGFVGPLRDESARAAGSRTAVSGNINLGPQPTPEQRAAADKFQEELREAVDETSVFATRAFENIQDASAQFFESAIRGFDDLKSVGQSALNALISTLAQSLSKSFLEGIFGGESGFLGLFGGARAGGGPVSAGVSYLVGEKGPELFIPRSSGYVAAGDAGGVIVEQHFHVQAGLPPQWQAQLGAVAQIASASAQTAVEKRLGGVR